MSRSSLKRSIVTSSILTFVVASLTIASVQVEATAAKVTFTQTEIASGDTNSYSIVSGDFNNDGILDLLTVNRSSLSFYKGLGGGKFAVPVNQSLPLDQAGYGQVFAADFNEDGKLDLAIASGQQGVTILLGNGNGTFNQGTNIAISGNASTIALADFNGDHKPDIAVSDNGGKGTTWIYLGNGDGTFTLSDTQPYGGSPMVVGDFNADGKQDVIYGAGIQLGLFLGNGDGTLSAPIIASTSSSVGSLTVGDFYNNRIQTLVALTSNSSAYGGDTYIYSVRYADGQLYVENQNLINGWSSNPPLVNVAGGDLNGDFLFDIFLSGSNIYNPGFTAYMLGNGDGTFQTLQDAPSASFISYQSPIVRDLNRDSRQDVAIAWNNLSNSTAGAEVLLDSSATVNCAPPPANKLGVNICDPTNGEIVGSSFTFKAAGNAFNGIAKRMELWIDGNKVGQNLEDQLNVTATLTAGTHTASFVVVDSFDNSTSKSVSFKSSN
jgi:hypothetical protein